MVNNILNKIINSEISPDEIFEWLTTDNPQSINFPDVTQTEATRVEFVLYFLDYVRKQCQGTLNVGPVDDAETHQKSLCSTPLKQNKKTCNDNGNISKIQTSLHEISLENNQNSSTQNNTGVGPATNQLTSTPMSKVLHNVNSFDRSVTPNLTKPCIVDYNRPFSSSQSPQSHSSPITPKIPGQSSFDTPGRINDSVGNASLNSIMSQELMMRSMMTNSYTSNPSLPSPIPCSPISPLYANQGAGKKSDRKSNNSRQRQKVAVNLDNSQTASSGQKNKKVDHNRSMSLGDFLTVDSIKKSGKKENSRVNLASQSFSEKDESMENKSHDAVSPKKNKSRRRIKPTKIIINSSTDNQQQNIFGVVSRPTTVNPQFLDVVERTDQPALDKSSDVTSFEIERGLLKMERQRQPRIDNLPEIAQQEPKNSIQSKASNAIVPKLELVDNTLILDTLAKIHGGLIMKNLVPNPMTELHFIISLITYHFKSQNKSIIKRKDVEDKISKNAVSLQELKETMGCTDIIDETEGDLPEDDKKKSSIDTNEDDSNHGEYFNSVHNCIYYATTVLVYGKKILTVLDRATLKLLCENTLLTNFQPTLRDYLNELYEVKFIQSKHFKPHNDSKVLQTNVCFQMDTDNRENFPSTIAFSTFRKQRDLFYEILKSWEDSHLQPNWSFHKSLERKINTMISMHPDVVNYYHIARLFKSQLLTSSIQTAQAEDTVDEETLSVLKSLKDVNPEKLQQLQQRLVTPLSSTGPVPHPSFPGVQEFYRDFLEASANPKFNVILEHCFIQEIMELNDTQFAYSDIDIKELVVDENTKQDYLTCISSLRLMAKFLGFLVALPFRSEVNAWDSMTTQIALRSRAIPSLDLRECLDESLNNGKLSLTIPWIVQYLALMDSVTFRLPYYMKLCEVLYCIYRAARNSLHQEPALLITFSIGWLFELPNFPKDLYFNWQVNYTNKKIQLPTNNARNETSQAMKKRSENMKKRENNIILDELNIIDDRTLYACCPFLKEFKILLISGNSNLTSSNANRHITPVTSQLPQPSNEIRTMSLELQLEEAFFHGQPRSVRKTIDFISERVASNCVKYICRVVIRKVKEKNYRNWRKSIRKAGADVNILDMTNLIVTTTKEIREQSVEIIPQLCSTKVRNSVEALLADDVLSCVREMCIKIAMRMAIERIERWLDSYINEAIASKEMFSELLNSRIGAEGETDEDELSLTTETIKIHNLKIPPPTALINDIRNFMWELIEKHGRWASLTEEIVLKNLKNLRGVLCERRDIVPSAERALYTMSVDYALHLIVFMPILLTPRVEDLFIEVWKINKDNKCDVDLFSGLLCPRNVKLFMQTTGDSRGVWLRYGVFIRRLLKENLINLDVYSDQCVEFLRIAWPVGILKAVSGCLMESISDYKSTDELTAKIKELVAWIAEMCVDLGHY